MGDPSISGHSDNAHSELNVFLPRDRGFERLSNASATLLGLFEWRSEIAHAFSEDDRLVVVGNECPDASVVLTNFDLQVL